MANFNSLQEAIDNFEAASTGPEVRQGLIDLLYHLSNMPVDTSSLGGYPIDQYVRQSNVDLITATIDAMLHYDTEPQDGRTNPAVNVIKNKDIVAYFGDKILKKIQAINGDAKGKTDKTPPDELGANIRDALYILYNNLENSQEPKNIRAAIEDKLQESGSTHHIEDTDNITDYATRIDQIKWTHVEVTPFTADHNGEYTIEDGKAYNPITVKLNLKGQDIVADHDGDYTPSEGFDGIKSVNVRVPASGGSGGGGYGGGSGKGTSDLGEDDAPMNVGPTDIVENGEYSASSYGFDGFSQVNIAVKDYEIPDDAEFTVTFQHPDGTVLDTQEHVKPGDYVQYAGDQNPPIYQKDDQGNPYNDDFWVFSGWEPMPIKVLSDMTCVAQFSNWYPNSANPTDVSDRFYQDEWNKVFARDSGTAVGDIKLLKINTGGNNGQVIRMRKVSNEGGSGGTWISMDTVDVGKSHVDNEDWHNSALKSYLNGEFFDNIIPDWLKPHIVAVSKDCLEKATMAADSIQLGTGRADKAWFGKDGKPSKAPTVPIMMMNRDGGNKIWLPGIYELNLMAASDGGEFSNNIYQGIGNLKIRNMDGKNCDNYHYPTNTYCGLVAFGSGSFSNYSGEVYNGVYSYFDEKGSKSFREFFIDSTKNSMYKDKDYGLIINNRLPHVQGQKIDGPDSKDPSGKYWSEEWDNLDFATQLQHSEYEPNLDLKKILLTDKGKYLPGLSHWYNHTWDYSGYPMRGYYEAMNGESILRDVWLKNCSVSYDSQNDRWTVSEGDYRRAITTSFGYLGRGYDGSGDYATAVIGFCLD